MDAERQTGTEKTFQNFFICFIRQGYFVQLVFFHEFIKYIGTDNNRAGYRNRNIGKLIEQSVTLDE